MGLNLRVHEFAVDKGSGRATIIKRTPYIRFVTKGEPAISFQAGKFYYDADPKPIAKEDIPLWVWENVKNMDAEYRKNLGLLLPTRLPGKKKVLAKIEEEIDESVEAEAEVE